MKTSELKGMSDEQLVLQLRDTERHLFQLRFQSATDRLETPSEMRKAKKDIARILTIQRQRELAALAGRGADQIAASLTELAKTRGGVRKRQTRRQIGRLKRLRAGLAPAAPAAQGGGK